MTECKGKVAIVGSGLIGRSWAMLFASGGYQVSIFDIKKEQIEGALTDISAQIQQLKKSGKLRGKIPSHEQLKLISASNDLAECVQNAIHVQECVPEILELKIKVFAQLDQLIGDNTVLSSSSSAMPCSKYTEHLRNRERTIVSHPVNPPYYMPLVELVPAPWTSEEVVTRTKHLMTDIGQAPVILKKEIDAFVQPRIQYFIIQECLKLVMEGVISPDDIDTLMTEGLAYHYSFLGPLEMLHLSCEGGIGEAVQQYADMYEGTQESSAGVRLANNPDMQQIFSALDKRIPKEDLGSRRLWRDANIANLSSARRALEEQKK